MAPLLEGRCFCGAIRFQLVPPTEFASHCHCRSCRLSHGAPMVTWTSVPRARFKLLNGQELLRTYFSSADVGWEFCSQCGSSLFYRATFAPEKIYVAAANLEALDRPVESHVSFEEHLPWMENQDRLPRLLDKGEVLFPGPRRPRLRPFQASDLGIFFQQQIEPEAHTMAGVPVRDWHGFHDHWQTNILGNSQVRQATIEIEEMVAGYLLTWPQDGKRWLGYWLGRAYWGRGVAQKALGDFLQQEPDRPLFARVSPENFASQKVLGKSGFERLDGEEVLYRLD